MTQAPTPPVPNFPAGKPASNMGWAAITSLICGIGSIFPGACCGLFCTPVPLLPALAGIVFGILGLKSSHATLAKIGIALSAIMLLLGVLFVLLVTLGIVSTASLQQFQQMPK